MKVKFLFVIAYIFFSQSIFGQINLGQGQMAGEVTLDSVILQARLTKGTKLINGDLPGQLGTGRFELSESKDFLLSFYSPWNKATPGNDYIIKAPVYDLLSDTQYYYRLIYGRNQSKTKKGPVGIFRTLSLNAKRRKPVRLIIISNMNYDAFHNGINAYEGTDKNLGYPAFETILEQNPNFLICAGNNVFYDDPEINAAKTVAQMRRKWHEQFAQPRLINLLHQVPTYWQKNDRDHRFTVSDTTTTDRKPTHKTGASVFKEQVPIVDLQQRNALTYRTHRLNKLVQIWLVETRDHRNANHDSSTENKTLWGQEQRDWLKQTIEESDAVFKLLISPTPMIGPDNAYKRDNHTNANGFRNEGDHFITWLRKNDFQDKNFYIICGDRSWQYHSEHLTHIEEFCTGTLIDAQAQAAIKPGNPKGTDPSALITQRYASIEPTGGFLTVDIKPGENEEPATAAFIFYDEKGNELYRVEKKEK